MRHRPIRTRYTHQGSFNSQTATTINPVDVRGHPRGHCLSDRVNPGGIPRVLRRRPRPPFAPKYSVVTKVHYRTRYSVVGVCDSSEFTAGQASHATDPGDLHTVSQSKAYDQSSIPGTLTTPPRPLNSVGLERLAPAFESGRTVPRLVDL